MKELLQKIEKRMDDFTVKKKLYILSINEQIQNIAQKKDTLCRRMYN